ncbi:MAG: endonuclease/exonuclease/phosphatase family protein [Propionibacteriaceae bacterium]
MVNCKIKRNIFYGIIFLVVGIFAGLSLYPASSFSAWLSLRFGIAQLLAFSGQASLILLLLLIPLSGYTLLRWIKTRRRDYGVNIVLLAVALVAVVGFICYPMSSPWVADTNSINTGKQRLQVVTFNSQNTFSRSDLLSLMEKYDPDIIILPESLVYNIKNFISGTPFENRVFDTPSEGLVTYIGGNIAPTTVLVHQRQGDYHYGTAVPTTFGTVSLVSDLATKPQIIGVHTAPPLPALMQYWREDLARIFSNIDKREQPPTILAGDFNATLRHGPLAQRNYLIDAAEQCQIPDQGTWPADGLWGARTAIDHIFVTPDIAVTECVITSLGEADHRALVVTLQIP